MRFSITLPGFDGQNIKNIAKWGALIIGVGVTAYYGYLYFQRNGATPAKTPTIVTEGNIKDVILSGEVKMYSGNIIKIEGQSVTINTSLPGENAARELTAMLTPQTLIRRVVPVPASATSTGLVPAKTSVASTTNLSIGSQIMMGMRADGSIAMIDIVSGNTITRPPDKIIEGIIPAKKFSATKDKILQLMRAGNLNMAKGIIKKIDLKANFITAEIDRLTEKNTTEKSEVILKITDGSLLNVVLDEAKQYVLWDRLAINDSVTIFYTKDNEILEITKP